MLGYHGLSHQIFSPPESLRCGGQGGLPNEESEEREWKGTESCHAGALSSDVTKAHLNMKPVIGCYFNHKLWTMNTAWNICNIKYMQTMSQ